MNDKEKKIDDILENLKKEPEFPEAENMFNDIMNAVDKTDQDRKGTRGKRIFKIVRKVMQAAAVLLIFIFGYEQYVLTNKMISLEKRVKETTKTNSATFKTMVLLNMGSMDYYSLSSGLKITRKSDLGSKLKIARASSFLNSNLNKRQIRFYTINNKVDI